MRRRKIVRGQVEDAVFVFEVLDPMGSRVKVRDQLDKRFVQILGPDGNEVSRVNYQAKRPPRKKVPESSESDDTAISSPLPQEGSQKGVQLELRYQEPKDDVFGDDTTWLDLMDTNSDQLMFPTSEMWF